MYTFYLEAVNELVDYVSFFKIASYELLWDDLLIECAKTGKPVIISSGMANIDEILHAVTILRNNGCKNLLYCIVLLPVPQLLQQIYPPIKTIRDATDLKKVGWSDHTVSGAVILNSVLKWGAEIIEFHLDIDGNGYEYSTNGHCWLPNQIKKRSLMISISLRNLMEMETKYLMSMSSRIEVGEQTHWMD